MGGPPSATEGDVDSGGGSSNGSRKGRGKLLALLGALVLAAVAAVVGFLVLRPDEGDRVDTASGSQRTANSVAPGGPTYNKGDCVTWDQAAGPPGTVPTRTVPCEEPHLLEIVGSFNVTADRFPDEVMWTQLAQRDCGPMLTTLLNAKWDRMGRYAPGYLRPDQARWDRGDHTTWCGVRSAIGRVDPSGAADTGPWGTKTGKAIGAEQGIHHILPPGSCESLDHKGPVPCDQPHHWEVVAHYDLNHRVEAPPRYDDEEAWDKLVGDYCHTAAVRYLGREPAGDISAGWVPVSEVSWEAGTRVVRCTIARYAKGAEDPTPVTGSLRTAKR